MSFTALLKKLRSSKTSSDEIKGALSMIDIGQLEAAAEKLDAERRRVLLDGDDKELADIESRIATANRDIERAIATKEELERRLADAVVAEEDGERRSRYRAAKVKGEQAAAEVARKYPGYAKGIAELIRILAEAAAEVQLANENLPSGVEPLPDPEFSVRGLPGLPRKIISEREVTRWYYVNNESVAPEAIWAALDREDTERRGVVQRYGIASPQRYEKRRFILREYLDAERMIRPDRLASINLPPLVAGDAPYWRAVDTSDVRTVLSRLASITQYKPATREDRREVRTELIPVTREADVASVSGIDEGAEAAPSDAGARAS